MACLAARVAREIADDNARIEELFLSTLSRLPGESERQASVRHLKEAESAEKGLQGILWGLINTREFLLNH